MTRSFEHQRAFSLIEVLVTILILSVGLLGIAGLQARLQMSEVEAYQRSQALILLNDMASRLASNRSAVANYVTGTTNPIGYGTTCSTSTTSRKDADLSEWCAALQGSAESEGNSRVGAMTGGRGCIESLGGGEYLITVAWQGMSPVSAPPTGLACGAGLYNGDNGSSCTADLCRRVVSTVVRIPSL